MGTAGAKDLAEGGERPLGGAQPIAVEVRWKVGGSGGEMQRCPKLSDAVRVVGAKKNRMLDLYGKINRKIRQIKSSQSKKEI